MICFRSILTLLNEIILLIFFLKYRLAFIDTHTWLDILMQIFILNRLDERTELIDTFISDTKSNSMEKKKKQDWNALEQSPGAANDWRRRHFQPFYIWRTLSWASI